MAYSAASAAGSSASNEPECGCSGTANPTPTASGCSLDTGPESPAIQTCPSCGGLMLRPSTSSAAAFPAKTSATPAPPRHRDRPAPARVFGAEYARLIGEIRPRYVIVENVPALLTRGLERVLADLAALRYDAEWDCLPASAFGAPHRRDRVWLVGYPHDQGQPAVAVVDETPRLPSVGNPDSMAGPPRGAREGGTAERWHNPERSNELSDQVAATGTPGALNPTWVEWLMGFPTGWTDLEASGTRSSPRSPNGSVAA